MLPLIVLFLSSAGNAQNIKSPYSVAKIISAMKHPKSDLTLISAHRATWEVYPENSFQAITESFKEHIETIEVDARFTSDQQLVISHDYKLDRVTSGTGFVFQKTLAQIQALNMRDRRGHIWHDAQGATTHPLSFDQLLDILWQRENAGGAGYVLIVDVKRAQDPSDPTDAISVLKACVQEVQKWEQSSGSSVIANSIVFKLKSKDLVDRATFESKTNWKTAADGQLIVVLSPDDAQISKAGYNPANDSFFQDFSKAPYVLQFEMNQYYNGDGLQPYFNAIRESPSVYPGTATYNESYFFPEGVTSSSGACCFPHITDPTVTPSAKQIIPDYRGDPEMSLLNATSLVTTDQPDTVVTLLKLLGKRNLAEINF